MILPSSRVFPSIFSRLLAVLLCSVLIIASDVEAAKETPFGVGLSLANAPDSNGLDLQSALAISSAVGSHMSVVWSWRKQTSIPFHTSTIPIAQQFGLKVLFQISPTALGSPTPPSGLTPSFADPDTRNKYLADVAYFASFKPDYMNLCAEVNLMYEFNRPEFDNYISLYNEAYALIKNLSPDTKVGVSMLDVLFVGYRQFTLMDEFDTVDFIGFTTYPAKILKSGILGDIENFSEFPRGWYDVARTVFPETPILYTEVGWSSKQISDENEQALFVAALPWLFEGVQPELVTWTLLHDTKFFQVQNLDQETLDRLAELGVDPEELFNRFNGMGIYSHDGIPKPASEAAFGLDFDNPVEPDFILVPLP